MMVRPSENTFDPSTQFYGVGEYCALLVGVTQGIKNRANPTWKPQTAFRFRIYSETDKDAHGRYVSCLFTESVWVNPHTGEHTQFMQFAHKMGAPNVEKGVDPQRLVGTWAIIQTMVKNGKCYVQDAILGDSPLVADSPVSKAWIADANGPTVKAVPLGQAVPF